MRIVLSLVVVGCLGVSVASAARRVDTDETAGATSLLTAERRARDAAERLRLPTTGPARWKAGGQGWAPALSREPKRAPEPASR